MVPLYVRLQRANIPKISYGSLSTYKKEYELEEIFNLGSTSSYFNKY